MSPDGVGAAVCEDARVTVRPAHFADSPDGFLPSPYARSRWGEDQLNGPAVVGLAAHCLERDYGSADFQPARLTVDLFKAARGVPTTVRARLIRDGRRIRNAECDVLQGDVVVARAGLVFYRRSSAPEGEQWSPPVEFTFPDSLPTGDEHTLPYTGSDAVGWTQKIGDHQNTSRTRFVDRGIDVVAGQPNTPFVRASVVGEATSLVTHLGTRGVGYINGDLTVGLTRLPVGEWIGVQAESHWAADGVTVGTATLFDGTGPFGSGMVTALANPSAALDFSTHSQPNPPA
ncbi:thioesterase [Mycolicibacterium chitae]|nr:thioesterase [Mycolicibacterium chitae]